MSFFYDVTARLVEWIDLLSHLGADKVFLYQLDVQQNVSKVLDYYYVKKGIVDLTPISLAGHQPNMKLYQHLYLDKKYTQRISNEVISLNDN